MSSTMIFVGLPEGSKSSITKAPPVTNMLFRRSICDVDSMDTSLMNSALEVLRVPNAPKSSIREIFNSDQTDGSPVKNGAARPRVVRDTPTRPRDTHSRLFGQVSAKANNHTVSPMVTDTIRSHINFGETDVNGGSPSHSPSKGLNGSAMSTPSRVAYMPPKRNPVTGDGVSVPPPRRRHPAASLREGNPITGDGYKSLNGQINTVTSVNGHSHIIQHCRVPPGGHASPLW